MCVCVCNMASVLCTLRCTLCSVMKEQKHPDRRDLYREGRLKYSACDALWELYFHECFLISAAESLVLQDEIIL